MQARHGPLGLQALQCMRNKEGAVDSFALQLASSAIIQKNVDTEGLQAGKFKACTSSSSQPDSHAHSILRFPGLDNYKMAEADLQGIEVRAELLKMDSSLSQHLQTRMAPCTTEGFCNKL